MSQTVTVKGTIARQDFGPGVWSLVSDDVTYELHNPPKELQQDGMTVSVEGQIRDDVMSLAMIGPILEVKHFKVQ
jgi:hypothetical protein